MSNPTPKGRRVAGGRVTLSNPESLDRRRRRQTTRGMQRWAWAGVFPGVFVGGLLLLLWATAYGVLATLGLIAIAALAGLVAARSIRRR